MGMYTRLKFHAELKDLSEKEIDAIKWCISNEDFDKFPYSDLHPFFKQRRALLLFTCDAKIKPIFINKNDIWVLNTDAEIKNYKGEIELFLDWIKPFVKTGMHVSEAYAETQYEEYEGYCYYYLDRVEDRQTCEY